MVARRSFFVLLFMTGSLFALDPGKRLSQFQLDSWGVGSGLPQNSVLSLLQARDGYLWLGMRNDLLRFDGVRFVGLEDPAALKFGRSFVLNLLQDRQDRLWACSWGSGLLCLENGAMRSYTQADGLGSNRARFALERAAAGLLVGTDNGVFRLAGTRFTAYCPSRLGGIDVKAILEDRHGRLWIGAISGLYSDDGRGETAVRAIPALANQRVWALSEDRLGNVLVGTEKGLFLLPQGDPANGRRVTEIPEIQVRALRCDSAGSMWIGTATGLARLASGNVDWLHSADGLLADYVMDLAFDREGSLWIATDGGGLNRLREEKFTFYTRREGLLNEMVRSLGAMPDGSVWVGTEGGVCMLRNGLVNRPLPQLHGKDIRALLVDREGALWLAVRDDGLFRFKEGTLRRVCPVAAGNGGLIRALFEDRRGRIWVGSGSGVFLLQGDTLRPVPELARLAGSECLAFAEDDGGTMWIGSAAGLARLQDGRASLLEPFIGKSSGDIECLHRDKENRLWLGTSAGLMLLDGGRFRHFSIADGMFEYDIYFILEDSKEQFWLATENGIWCVPRQQLLDRAADRIRRTQPLLFTEKDGLKSIVCNGRGQSSGCRDRNGWFWFPMAGGVASVNPAAQPVNRIAPPMVIEDMVADDVRFTGDAPLELAAGTRRLSIHYTATSFVAPERVRFRVKLDGFDGNWREAGMERVATFTNLRPGTYTFRVRACNSDNVWNESDVTRTFVIRSFVYQRWWFIVLALLTFAVSSYMLIRFARDYVRVHAFWKKKNYIGHFKLLEVIGTGGMGTVYKAVDLLADNRVVALKVLKEENFDSESHQKRFRNEAAVIDQLDHPNIVQIQERGQVDDHLYIAMELVEGVTLARRIRERGPLPLGDALEVMSQVAAALERIHAHSIVHRDLKPENIIVGGEPGKPKVKLLDFGLAINPAHSRLTETGIVIGTLHYMPPERLSSGTSLQPGDIYSMGMIFYEALTALKPFAGDDTMDVVKKILNETPPALDSLRPDVPPALCALITRMIEKDPDYRPAVAEVRTGLLAVQREQAR